MALRYSMVGAKSIMQFQIWIILFDTVHVFREK